ncbi:MAG: hypothetical protein GY719_26245 [bacterium]|nr:hypothetical protein [bacterium]
MSGTWVRPAVILLAALSLAGCNWCERAADLALAIDVADAACKSGLGGVTGREDACGWVAKAQRHLPALQARCAACHGGLMAGPPPELDRDDRAELQQLRREYRRNEKRWLPAWEVAVASAAAEEAR